MGFTPTTASDLETAGAALYPGAALLLLADLRTLAAIHPPDQAGVRLHGDPHLGAILASDAIRAIVRHRRPVRAILFDKTAAAS
jgi:hypothetical protein